MGQPARVAKVDSLEFTAEDIEKLIGKMEPKLRAGFIAAIVRAKEQNTLDEISDLIQAGRLQQAIDAAATAGARALADAANTVLVQSGQALASALTEAFGITVSFDQVNWRAVRRMQEAQLRMVRQFTEGQRHATREAIVDGIRRGLNPRDQARAFRDSMGLTEKQERAVHNYRRLLGANSREALNRKLRDKRFDRTVLRAIENDTPLSQDQIDRMVGRYRERYLKYRSEVIARTEALRAVHEGTEEMVQQGIDGGLINPDGAEREWVTARDERVRDPAHTSMNGQTRPMGQPFESGAGNLLRYPGDPEAPASETVQCRCVVATRITNVTA